MTPQQKNDAAASGFMAQHGADLAAWYGPVLEAAGGPPPFTRDVAIAHEAGHAIVGMTLGGIFKHVSVYADSKRRWCGWTEVEWPGVDSERVVNVLSEPVEALHSLLHKIAGFCGEEIAGLDHPASSPDEVYPFVQTCSTVAHFRKLDADELIIRIMADARHRIYRNRELFTAIRRSMTVVNELRPAAMAKLIEKHGLVQLPLKAAW
jgi:hypothetical protein